MVEFVQNEKGKHQFKVMSNSGAKLLVSKSFDSQVVAKSTLNDLRKHPVFERKTNHDGKFIVLLKNAKGEVIGKSNPYDSEAGMENGLLNLQNRLLKDS